MGVSGNPANRAAARAQGRGSVGRVLSQLIVLENDEAGGASYGTVATAIVAGLESLVTQGGAPLERSAITIGTDHPEYPGAIVIEVKTDRRAPKPTVQLGAPLELGGE